MNDKPLQALTENSNNLFNKRKAVPTGHIFKQLLRVCHPNAFVILKAFVIPADFCHPEARGISTIPNK